MYILVSKGSLVLLFGKTRFSNLLNDGLPMPLLSFSAHEVSGSLLPRQFPITQFNNHILEAILQWLLKESFPTLTLQNDAVPTDILGTFPQLKSVTWAVENKTADLESRVAVITVERWKSNFNSQKTHSMQC